MKVFLTGGTGFIGQPLAKQMVDRGWMVCALVRNPESKAAKRLQAFGCTLLKGDVTNRESMCAGMQGVDVVVHNAAVYETGVVGAARQMMYDINVNGTENVLNLAQELQIQRILYVSSVTNWGDSGTLPVDETFKRQARYHTYYEETKTRAHEIAERYQQAGLPVIIASPNAAIGVNDHAGYGYFIRMYINYMQVPFAWKPDVVHAAVHVEDLANGMALAVEKGRIGETYFFSGEPLTVREILNIWGEHPGSFKVRFYVPTVVMKVMTMPLAPLLRLVGLPAFLSPETVDSVFNMNYSAQKAQKELGWKFRSGREAWNQTIRDEISQRRQRKSWNPLTWLKPLE